MALLFAVFSTAVVAQTDGDKLRELEATIEELRAAIAELSAELSAEEGDDRVTELERQVRILAEEIEKLRIGEAADETTEGVYGLGSAASKVYRVDQGLSIGGYGEMLYENFATIREDGSPSGEKDQLDFLRAVLYFGYKFNDKWVFNSEIELEHASTSSEGSASVEFAYVDYLWKPTLNPRVGMVLIPMGFLNELHEPPLFLSTERPNIERAIIPSTWRENGLGIFGDVGPFSYRTYIVNGLDGSRFSSSGLRGGRQKGSEALAEDFGWTGRLDYTDIPGLTIGASAYIGNSGQGLLDVDGSVIDAKTEIFDLHLDWQVRGFHLRGLYTMARVGDVARLNEALGKTGSASIGDELSGYYIEVGYDVLAHRGGRAGLVPFVRTETIDTQSGVPPGYGASGSQDSDILTLGLAYKPIDQLVFKIDHQDRSDGGETGIDQWNLAMGYLF